MSGHKGEQGELARAHMLKTLWDFYIWARDKSGLQTPAKSLEEKHGKGIFRRFFYWIPAKGVGAVSRTRLPTFKSAKGSSRLHEFVDIGVPGTVSTRRASCHQCEQCWAGNRRECLNKAYCGSPKELEIEREHTPTTSLSQVITGDPNPHPQRNPKLKPKPDPNPNPDPNPGDACLTRRRCD